MVQGWAKGGEHRKVEYVKNGKGYSMNINWTPVYERIEKAQFALDAQVWQDVQKYMPVGDSGQLKAQTAQLNAKDCGTGKVHLYPVALPYGHYLYEGILYVDPEYHCGGFPIYDNGVFVGFRSRLGVEKVPSNKRLHYSQPKAVSHWGDAAVRDFKKKWEQLVYKELNK